MDSILFGAATAAIVFAGGAIGLQLQRALPDPYTVGGPRDMIGAVTGLVTLLLALVLGLLIWTAYGVYSTQKGFIQTIAVNDLKLDGALNAYGPEATEGRTILRSGVERTIAQVWGSGSDVGSLIKSYRDALFDLTQRETYLKSLQPSSEKQKAAQAEALQAAAAVGQGRLQMALALIDPVNIPLLCVVIAWATALFCGYGLLSKRHPMSYIAMAVGALAVASAIEFIVDLSEPYMGSYRISQAPLTEVLKAVDLAPK